MGTVIKAEQPRQKQRLTPYRYTDITDQMSLSVQAAKRRAAKILADAEREAAAARGEAECDAETASQQLEKVSQDHLARDLELVRSATQSVVDQLVQANGTRRAQLESYVFELAVAIAERIVRTEFDKRPEINIDLLRESLQFAKGLTDVRIIMHPVDLATLGTAVDQLLAEFGRLGRAEIVAEESVGRGGCRVETDHGVIDQTLAAQLERVREELSVDA